MRAGLRDRVARVTHLGELRRLESRVADLDDGIRENRQLEPALEAQVAAMERSLVRLLDARVTRLGGGTGGGAGVRRPGSGRADAADDSAEDVS
ncbi:MAG: hypothetical protein ACRCYQ_02200 [Nocardioides sp.]